MADFTVKIPPLSFTPLSNIFIDKYLSDARGDYVKIYIYCLRLGYSGQAASTQRIAKALDLLETDVLNGLKYWDDKGVVRLSPEGSVEILENPSPADDCELPFDNRMKDLLDSIEKLVGRPLSSKEVHTYMSWIEDFDFSPEMITLLVEYCSSKHKLDIRYIEKVAMAWHDAGIKSIEDAMDSITKREEKWNNYRAILTFMGLKDNDIAKPQEEFLDKWLFKYNFSVDLINEACRICIKRINECSFSYMDAIINDWYKSGVKTVMDLKKLNTKKKPAKKVYAQPPGNYTNQRKYDIAELERQLLGRSEEDEQ